MNTLDGKKFSGGKNVHGKNSSFLCDNSGFKNTKSGALYIFNDPPAEGQNGPIICVDINGKKGPNRYGIDYFLFIFTVDGRVLPMGMTHSHNRRATCTNADGSCQNFANIGTQYCSKTNNITKNTSCAYYALTDTHPTQQGKNYWQDFLGEVYSR